MCPGRSYLKLQDPISQFFFSFLFYFFTSFFLYCLASLSFWGSELKRMVAGFFTLFFFFSCVHFFFLLYDYISSFVMASNCIFIGIRH